MTLPENFLSWHSDTNDSLDFKKTYVDMANDLVAGLMLSQIIDWYFNNKQRCVDRNGVVWFVKEHKEWYTSCRITKSRVPRALKILKEQELIITEVHLFDKKTTTYIRINTEGFIRAWQSTMKPNAPNLWTEKALPRNTEKALPGNTEKALPGNTEKALPGNTEKALPGNTEKALPGNTEKTLPGNTEKTLLGNAESLDTALYRGAERNNGHLAASSSPTTPVAATSDNFSLILRSLTAFNSQTSYSLKAPEQLAAKLDTRGETIDSIQEVFELYNNNSPTPINSFINWLHDENFVDSETILF